MSVTHISKMDFQKNVIDQKGTVLVDFYAEWCGPCKMTGPILEELSEEIKDVKFVKIDVDKDSELASQYSVFSIPTFIIFKEGKVVSQFVGAQPKESFIDQLKKASE